jgi:hypothetical protein
MRRIPRPEVPSIVRGHPRACVNRCRSRARSRDGFRYDPALGAPSLTAPRAPLSRRPWLRCARPPSPRIAPFRDFHARTSTRASLGQAAAQRLLQLHPNARTHPRASGSRLLRRVALRSHFECALAIAALFKGVATFPSRRRITRAASRDNPSDIVLTALQARRKPRHRKLPISRDAACGRRLDPTTACGDDR